MQYTIQCLDINSWNPNYGTNLGLKSHNYWPKLLRHSQIPSIAIKHHRNPSEYAISDKSLWVYVGIVGEKPNFGSNLGLKWPKFAPKFLNHSKISSLELKYHWKQSEYAIPDKSSNSKSW